jgi:cytochrome c oxidase assembly protein subunit 15
MQEATSVPPLYNLAPLIELLILAAAIAGFILYFWQKHNAGLDARGKLQALCAFTVFLCFDLIIFGAFTRLTDSGLGCPDWPGCYGQASPFGAHAEITAAQNAMPTGPVTHTKAWIEMIHRYLASGIGALIVFMLVWTWRLWLRSKTNLHPSTLATAYPLHNNPHFHPLVPTLSFFWVCIQGAFGALTVTMKLQPIIVTLHLLGGMLLLVLLRVQLHGYSVQKTNAATVKLFHNVSVAKRVLIAATFLLWIQIALGAWVSSNYAVLACNGYPLCNGSVIPDMNFQQGFELWRALGQTGNGQVLSMPALVAIHFAHRWFALVSVFMLMWAAWMYLPILRRLSWILFSLIALQFVTGLSNIVLGWPLLAALLHTGGAAALVWCTTVMLLHSHQHHGRI